MNLTLEYKNIDNDEINVNIDIDTYGIYMICGKNGSGKTTIAKKLQNKYQSLIGIMAQENDLILSEENIIDNIDMYQGNKERIYNILEKFELKYILDKNQKHLSGGEKRLISLLRTLLSNKEIIILDEPSNDIDYIVFNKALELIKYFSKEKSILIISHDDRFDIYRKKYIIEKNEFRLEEDNEIEEKIKIKNEKIEIKNIKNRKKNFIIYMALIINTIIFMQSIFNGLKDSDIIKYEEYNDDIYQIISPVTMYTEDYSGEDAINTSLFQSLLKSNKSNYLKKDKNNISKIDIEIEIDKNSIDSIYPKEYYDLNEKQYFKLEDAMGEIITSDEKYLFEFNTTIKDFVNGNLTETQKVYLPKNIEKEVINRLEEYKYEIEIIEYEEDTILLDFNEQLYYDALEIINQKQDILLINTIVKLKPETDILEFLLINEMEDKNYYVRGNDVYVLMSEANIFSKWSISVRNTLIYISLITILMFIIINIYENANINRYKLFKYYGFEKKVILNSVENYYILKNYNEIICITMIIITMLMYYIHDSYTVIMINLLYLSYLLLIKLYVFKFIKKKIGRLIR